MADSNNFGGRSSGGQRRNDGDRRGSYQRGGAGRGGSDDRRDDRRGGRGGWQRDNGDEAGDRREYRRERGEWRDGERRDDRRDRQREDRPGRRRDDRRDDRRGGYGHENRRDGRRDDRRRNNRLNPRREGYREERMAQKEQEPDLPQDLDITVLDPSVLQDLKGLSKENANRVAKHMIMAADLVEDDPKLALEHARAAKNRAGRVGVVRETNGVVAYRAGEWKEALSELRAARRISGGPGLLAVMADAERGLGRPEKALEVGRSPEADELDAEGKVELAIVLAGARHDLGQHDSALATLQRLNPSTDITDQSGLRLAYAYADALALAGKSGEALEWFTKVRDADAERLTDADERIAELS